MRFLRNLLSLLPLLFNCWTTVSGQTYTIERKHFTTEDGLSHNAVSNIFEDSRGLLWITTRYGVNRFDGENFRTYTRDRDGLHNSNIDHVLEDPDGILWMLTGIDGRRYLGNYEDVEFTLFDPRQDRVIDTADYLPAELIAWLGNCHAYTRMNDGTLAFFSNDGYIIHYRGKNNYSSSSVNAKNLNVTRIFPLGDSAVYLLASDDRLERSEKDYFFYLNGREKPGPSPVQDGNMFRNFSQPYPYTDGRTWKINVSRTRANDPTPTSGYYLLDDDFPSGIVTLQDSIPSLPSSARPLFIDQPRSEYWVSINDTVFLASPRTGQQRAYPELRLSSSNFRDHHGNFYVFDGEGGFSLFLLQPNRFRKTGLPGLSHRSLAVDDAGNLYAGIDATNFPDIKKALAAGTVIPVYNYGLSRDQRGNIWAGTDIYFGYIQNASSQVIRRIPDPETPARIYSVNQATVSTLWTVWEHPLTGAIWYADLFGRVSALSPESGEIMTILTPGNQGFAANTTVYAFTLDANGTMWISSTSGLYRLDAEYRIAARYQPEGKGKFHLPGSDIHHCYIDDDGTFWLSTGDAGLIKWHPDGAAPLRQYTMDDGLPSMVLHAAYEDNFGYLWIPSENGIIQFNKTTELLTVYGPEDGTSDIEYNRTSHYGHPDGTLYFGGINGVTKFHPDSIQAGFIQQPADHYIVPLDVLRLDGPSGQRTNEIATLTNRGEIILTPKASSARLHLLPGKLAPTIYHLSSQLVGVQKDPIPVVGATVNLEGLPYGSHDLIVCARDINGNLLQKVTYTVKVLRPVYLKVWFLALLVLAIGLIAFLLARVENYRLRGLVRTRTRQIERDKQMIEKQAVELRQLDEMKSRFFANVSHELRTPLTLILGPIKRLLQSNDLPAEAFTSLRRAHTNGERLRGLIKDILDLSRLEQGKMQVERTPLPIEPFLNRTVDLFSSLAEQQSIRLGHQVSLPPGTVLDVDRQKLETILRNLLINAVKFTPADGTVTLLAFYNAEQLRIVVSDTGRGIAAEDLPRIFDRFYQSRHGRSGRALTGGTGIGLAICRELTELMDGTIAVDSTPGEGSVFTVTLPASVSESAAAAPITPFETGPRVVPDNSRKVKSEDHKAEQVETNGRLPHLLIVEDNPDLRDYLFEILHAEYRLTLKDNGRRALDFLLAKDSLPDLVITDLMMPEMDGFQLLRRLKEEPELSPLPCIVLSALATHGDRMNALRTGIDDYILKPFDEQELRQRIRNLLTNAHARRRAIRETSIPDPTPPARGEAPSTASTVTEEAWLKAVDQTVRERLADPDFGNAELAAVLFVSPRTLSRKMKAATGLTTNKYMLEIRLTTARTLLEQRPRPTLQTVAETVGFRKASYLSGRFRERFGVSPAEYGL